MTISSSTLVPLRFPKWNFVNLIQKPCQNILNFALTSLLSDWRFCPISITGDSVGAIHSTKISGPKLNDRFGPEKFRKNWSTFWGGPLFPVGLVGILVEWIAPISSEIGLKTRSWQNKRPFAGFSRVISCSPYLDADCSNLPMIGWNDFTREKFVLQIGISSQIHLTFLTSAPDQLQLSSVKFPFICVVYSCALCMKCLTT